MASNSTQHLHLKAILKPLLLALLTMSLALGVDSHPAFATPPPTAPGLNFQEILRDALVWIEGLGAMGAIAYIALYIIATVAFLPGSFITLGGGAVYGVVLGSLYVFMGASIGATLAFLIGRYLARDWVLEKIASHENFRKIDEAVGKEGFKIIFLARLSPVFPFNLLNYALGVTGVSLMDYLLGFIGMIPGTIMYVYLGSLASSFALIGTQHQPTNSTVQLTLRVIGFIATVAVTLFVTHIARKALNEKVI
jgi:uncharacterized membrane protein YdjX (TVP38/TMEM64 family)